MKDCLVETGKFGFKLVVVAYTSPTTPLKAETG